MKFQLPRPGKKLQDDVFCLTEERNFFESKFLDQVSEISEMKKQLLNSKREVARLRGELMGGSFRSLPSALPPKDTVETEEDDCNSDASSLTEDDARDIEQEDNRSDDGSTKSAKEVRRSAEALLKWADFRSITNTIKTSATSTISSPAISISIPRSIEGMDDTNESDDDTNESDDDTNESDDDTSESDDDTSESDDDTTESDDDTTESDDDTTESDDDTTESDDDTTESD